MYSKDHKTQALGVNRELLRAYGGVCEEVAKQMALGALEHSPAHLALSVTGVLGPETDEDGGRRVSSISPSVGEAKHRCSGSASSQRQTLTECAMPSSSMRSPCCIEACSPVRQATKSRPLRDTRRQALMRRIYLTPYSS